MIREQTTAKEVFTNFDNWGGWSSIGAACIIGQLTATGSLGGSDSPARTWFPPEYLHRTSRLTFTDLAEEVRKASTVVPRMMITTIFLNGIHSIRLVSR